MKRDLYFETFPFPSSIPNVVCSSHWMGHTYDDDVDDDDASFSSIPFSFLTWLDLLWHDGYSLDVDISDAHPNHDLHLVIFCCFTLRLNVPCC